MNSKISRADAAWGAGSLLAWLLLSFTYVINNGVSSFTNLKVWIAFFLFAIQGVILHIRLFKHAKPPKTLSQALRKGALLALLVLVLYAFSLSAIGWFGQALGLKGIAAICSIQVLWIIEGLPLFVFQALLGGSIAGFARWKSLEASATVPAGHDSTT